MATRTARTAWQRQPAGGIRPGRTGQFRRRHLRGLLPQADGGGGGRHHQPRGADRRGALRRASPWRCPTRSARQAARRSALDVTADVTLGAERHRRSAITGDQAHRARRGRGTGRRRLREGGTGGQDRLPGEQGARRRPTITLDAALAEKDARSWPARAGTPRPRPRASRARAARLNRPSRSASLATSSAGQSARSSSQRARRASRISRQPGRALGRGRRAPARGRPSGSAARSTRPRVTSEVTCRLTVLLSSPSRATRSLARSGPASCEQREQAVGGAVQVGVQLAAPAGRRSPATGAAAGRSPARGGRKASCGRRAGAPALGSVTGAPRPPDDQRRASSDACGHQVAPVAGRRNADSAAIRRLLATSRSSSSSSCTRACSASTWDSSSMIRLMPARLTPSSCESRCTSRSRATSRGL